MPKAHTCPDDFVGSIGSLHTIDSGSIALLPCSDSLWNHSELEAPTWERSSTLRQVPALLSPWLTLQIPGRQTRQVKEGCPCQKPTPREWQISGGNSIAPCAWLETLSELFLPKNSLFLLHLYPLLPTTFLSWAGKIKKAESGKTSSLDNPGSWLSGDQKVMSEEGHRSGKCGRILPRTPQLLSRCVCVNIYIYISIYTLTHIDFAFEKHIIHYLQPLDSVSPGNITPSPLPAPDQWLSPSLCPLTPHSAPSSFWWAELSFFEKQEAEQQPSCTQLKSMPAYWAASSFVPETKVNAKKTTNSNAFTLLSEWNIFSHKWSPKAEYNITQHMSQWGRQLPRLCYSCYN